MAKHLMLYRPEVSGPHLIRAAQYVRMSTEHQRYSTENQGEAIAEYAAVHGYEVVRTYADQGISGLRLRNRKGLKRLLDDVITKQADFAAILVLDVSRWGRFQDTDESAAYEYMCRKAGVQIIYVAEPFSNDVGPLGSVIKSLKRAMAAEYSRDLSAKIHRAQAHIAAKGFLVGGPSGYGLRRAVVSEDGRRKAILERGEFKYVATDRVILVPGPRHEIAIVRLIFQLYVRDKYSPTAIANELNERRVPSPWGRRWYRDIVRRILRNDKYVGDYVYNRTSFKLGEVRLQNDPSKWVRVRGAFKGIISRKMFAEAAARYARWTSKLTNDQMLDLLREVIARGGRLSADEITANPDLPACHTYTRRFGGLANVWKKLGYEQTHKRWELSKAETDQFRYQLADQVRQALQAARIPFSYQLKTWTFEIYGSLKLVVAVLRYEPTHNKKPRWAIGLNSAARADLTLAARMNEGNTRVLDYFLLPRIRSEALYVLRFGFPGREWLNTYKSDAVQPLLSLVADHGEVETIMHAYKAWALANAIRLGIPNLHAPLEPLTPFENPFARRRS